MNKCSVPRAGTAILNWCPEHSLPQPISDNPTGFGCEHNAFVVFTRPRRDMKLRFIHNTRGFATRRSSSAQKQKRAPKRPFSKHIDRAVMVHFSPWANINSKRGAAHLPRRPRKFRSCAVSKRLEFHASIQYAAFKKLNSIQGESELIACIGYFNINIQQMCSTYLCATFLAG